MARTIGFVGLGRMGGPMVRRLARAGHVVRAYDVSAAARAQLGDEPGVEPVDTLSGVVDGASLLLLMLPSSDVVDQVLGADGLLAALGEGMLVVDAGSSEPARTRALAETLDEVGVRFVDAPVSGGVRGAEAGSLTVMVGGPAEVFTELEPVLRVLGQNLVHVDERVGSGHAVKALNNLMSASHLLATSEAMLAARAFGIDPAVVLEIVNTSSGRSGSTEVKWPRFVLDQSFDSGFALRLMLKDMRIALGLAHQEQTPAPLAEAAVAAWSRAADAMPEGADHTEIVRWLESLEPDAEQ
jgi:3-hydroxyisobutyrate dehydrogenase